MRPPEFQPPTHGSASAATGTVDLVVDTVTGDIAFDLQVTGIDSSALDSTHGGNNTAIHVHLAGPDERGPIILDVHHWARDAFPETDGLLVGAYEKDGRFWAEDGTPLDFGHELFADDLDRIEPNILRACERVPALASAGIKRVINGPMIWTPDVYALVGPVPGLSNYYAANGMIPGFSQGPGVAKSLAE